MTLHLFGAGSSPEYSNFAVKRTAEEREREFWNSYVDDTLRSVPKEKYVVELEQAVKETLTTISSSLILWC